MYKVERPLEELQIYKQKSKLVVVSAGWVDMNMASLPQLNKYTYITLNG
jgi:hypothetical protein